MAIVQFSGNNRRVIKLKPKKITNVSPERVCQDCIKRLLVDFTNFTVRLLEPGKKLMQSDCVFKTRDLKATFYSLNFVPSRETSLGCYWSLSIQIFWVYDCMFPLPYFWLPESGSHVTSRNQGSFSRQEREPWERGWMLCTTLFVQKGRCTEWSDRFKLEFVVHDQWPRIVLAH